MKNIVLINYKLLAVAVFILILGFVLLYQPPQDHANTFNYEIFNTRSLVISPIVILIGYALIAVAIVKPSKKFGK